MSKYIRAAGVAIIAVALVAALDAVVFCNPEQIPLDGKWSVVLDGSGQAAEVTLPGTIDTNGLGVAPSDTTETTHLTRISAYKGSARYSREIRIPRKWKGEEITLFLERSKPSKVYIDGVLMGSGNDISTPQRYPLGSIEPGEHLLEVVVDNSHGVPEQIYASSHAYTEDTQTNWNGIIGQIRLQISEPRTHKTEVLPCFRDFHIEGSQFWADGHKIYLRGKQDAAVWPLTGHVAMSVEEWRKYLGTCAEYGINHLRFHSWCPPEAAFEAADELGIYLQPELPFWGTFDAADTTLMSFLHKEGENILREYGHHPSFRMMALGNELSGDIALMKQFADDFRSIAPDKYYTFGSNYYLGYQGIKPGMDYFVTCRIGGEGWGGYGTHTRGSFSFADAADGGLINHFYPSSDRNFDEACTPAGIPIISHETGQFQTYPDYGEIRKYTGVLYPYNLEVFRRRLADAGMLDQAADFHKASGLWSIRLYKADIEMDLRTRDMAGYQLLDLQDYPGQGSAYVGVLDAFMESKGITTPEEWRQWCSPVVPLLVTDRFCYSDGETLQARVQLSNYGASSFVGKTLRWKVADAQGALTLPDGEGLLDVGEISYKVSTDKAVKEVLTLSIDGTDFHNSYDLWFYPRREIDRSRIVITRELSADIASQLEAGASVLWIPSGLPYTVGGLFQTDYWNYRMFKTICQNNHRSFSPGTMGLLTDPEHPLFGGFPTEMHSNWQWFDIVKNSTPLILDNFPESYRPVVQVIDNIERNHKLGLVMEWKVGAGKLLVCMADLEKVLSAGHPEGRAFCESLLDYMRSAEFNPAAEISVAELQRTLATAPRGEELEELNNISQY